MKRKWLAVTVAVVMAAGAVLGMMRSSLPVSGKVEQGNNYVKKHKAVDIKKQIADAVLEQGIKNEKSEAMVKLLVVSNGSDITGELKKLGAEVYKKSTSIYVVNIPANKALGISGIKNVATVGKDRILSLPEPINSSKISMHGGIAYPDLEFSHQTTGITKFWRQGYDGRGTKVAIIDTGVEPGNEMLTLTSDGKIKIVDWQDFMDYSEISEGDVFLSEKEVKLEGTKKYVDDNGRKVYLPSSVQSKVLYGTFNESNLVIDIGSGKKSYHDVNNNGKQDKISVIVDKYSDNDKLNDVTIVDTNFNNDLSDDKAMGTYKEVVKGFADKQIFELDQSSKPVLENGKPKVRAEYATEYNKLLNNFYNFQMGYGDKDMRYNFVITRVENNEGQWMVNLGYDGNSHGSHVAGDAAGNGYKILPFVDTTIKDSDGQPISDGTLKGAAPGAQVIACRVFQSSGGTPQSSYMAAMEYACENGADVINMSLGSLPDLNDGTDPPALFANQLSKKHGTVFCMSAGNEGPSTNALGTPGASEWAVTVGAYNPSWENYGYEGMEDGLWYFSSRGPTEDGRLKPTILAPGSMISSMPMWLKSNIRENMKGGGAYTGYGLEQGTSMSSPYTAGTIAAIKQAVKEKQLPYHPLVMKEAIFETGNKTLNNKIYLPTEIGGGMIDASEALKYLENLKSKGLAQETLVNAEGYMDRSAMNLKTEFNYSEKLNYMPEGLYVRSGDIPDKVNVTITNTEDKDLNLDLVKDSYNYDNSWLTFEGSKISLKKGESKVLTLNIDKTKLNRGINSVMIRMDDPSTIWKDGIIPVTVINYMDLTLSSNNISEAQERDFKPGTVDKHFLRIPYGAEKVEIEIQLSDLGDPSTLLPIITAPTGIQEDVAGADWIYTMRNRATLTLNNPSPGTWEIDLFSGIISAAEAQRARGGHTVTARIKGVAFEPSVIKYSGKGGEYKENDMALKLLNATGKSEQKVKLVKTNMVGENTNKKVERKNIQNGGSNIVRFTIPENDPNLFARIATTKVANAGDDLDLYLCKVIKNPNGTESLSQPIADSGNSGSEESIYIEGLSAGEYAIFVDAYDTAEQTSYELIYQIANNSFGENAITLRTEEITLGSEVAEVKLGVRVPTKSGKYFGLVSAVDEDGRVLGRAKVEAVSEGTDNSILLKFDEELVRQDKNFSIMLDGDIKDVSKMNNIYGIQFELNFDSSVISAEEVLKGDLFNGTDCKELFRKIEVGKITYAVGLLNANKDKDATGVVSGNLSKIKLNAKGIGRVSFTFNKLLVVNYLGDEISINTVISNSIFAANPDLNKDSKSDIRDVAKLAYKVGKSKGQQGYDANLDLNKDDIVDHKDLNFMIKCFNEDN